MNKKRLLYLIPILTLLLVSNCYSECITEYKHTSQKNKKDEKSTSVSCLTGQYYVSMQKYECSFPQISVQEIPDIDKSMIIQGNSAIDPYMLIAPPGEAGKGNSGGKGIDSYMLIAHPSYICIESSKTATPPPDNK